MSLKKVKTKKLIAIILSAFLGLTLLFDMPEMSYALSLDATINVSQVFTEEAPEGKTVSYVLTTSNGLLPEGGAQGEYGFTLDGTEDGELPITGFSSAGEFEYTLKAIPDSRQGYVFDDTEYIIKIYVKSDGCTVNIYNKNGDKVEKALFTHSYGEADPFIAVDPPVKKKVEGNPEVAGEFRFRLRAMDNDAGYTVEEMPMPEGSENGEKYLTIIGQGEEEFGEWVYIKAGTYVYDISEVNTGETGYTYDTNMFTITDVVIREDNVFTVERTIIDARGNTVESTLIVSGDSENPTSLEFVNKYDSGLSPGGDDDDGGNDSGDDSGGNTGGSDDNGGSGGKVRTGDTYRPILWIALWAIASIGTILMLMLYRHKREEKN